MNKKALAVIVLLIVAAAAAAIYFLVLAPASVPVEAFSAYMPGDYVITNIKDSQYLIKATVVLEVNRPADDEEFYRYLEENQHIIRDVIVMTLRSKTYDELMAEDPKALLADELITKINQKLQIDNVKDIYFADYVVN
ncbi:MAG: flagellar basal body-associated FliL family protein [Clostridiales bacterium]|jgi:flagellar FliL protein|nr:flagellar basal body-associated FliL family protein [Clostridiales bacterium]